MALYDLERYSPEDRKRMNESMLADIHGDDAILPPRSRLSVEALNFFYAINNLYSSVHRFLLFEKMFRRYPWQGIISKSDHIQSVYYLLIHECYIFEERLGKLFSTAKAYATKNAISFDLRQGTREIMRLHKRTFSGALRMRGTHVHQDEFIPKDIKRIGLLDSMAFGYGRQDAEAGKVWTRYRDLVATEVRKEWVQHCKDAQKASEDIATEAFRLTKPIWTRLSQE